MYIKYGVYFLTALVFFLISFPMFPSVQPGVPIKVEPFTFNQVYFERPWYIYHVLFTGSVFIFLATIKEMSKEYQAKILEGSIEPSASLNFFSMVDEYYLGYCPSVHKSLYPTAFQEQHAARRTRWTLCFWLAVAAFYCSPYPQSLL